MPIGLQIEQAAVARLGAVAFVSNVLRHEGPLALYRSDQAYILQLSISPADNSELSTFYQFGILFAQAF